MFWKKPCEHKNSSPINVTLSEGLNIVNYDVIGTIEREVHFCRGCRVLFLPWDKEKIGNFHEKS